MQGVSRGFRLAPIAGVAALLASLACGPVPGGRLSGSVDAPPPDWSGLGTGLDSICEIESRPSDPHSIQLQCYEYDGALYVHSHRWALASWYPFESWASIWLEHPDVRVRFSDSIYELHAERVGEAALRTKLLNSRGYDSVPEGILLFHLRPRS